MRDDPVQVTRLNATSILISPQIDQTRYLDSGPRPSYNITIDGTDFSSMAIVRHQGLTDSLIPENGLLYTNQFCETTQYYCNGTPVIITGPEVSNSTGPRHVLVRIRYPTNWLILADIKI